MCPLTNVFSYHLRNEGILALDDKLLHVGVGFFIRHLQLPIARAPHHHMYHIHGSSARTCKVDYLDPPVYVSVKRDLLQCQKSTWKRSHNL